MSKLSFLDDMVREMEARKLPLLEEKRRLEDASRRLAEINQELDMINTELAFAQKRADAARPAPVAAPEEMANDEE